MKLASLCLALAAVCLAPAQTLKLPTEVSFEGVYDPVRHHWEVFSPQTLTLSPRLFGKSQLVGEVVAGPGAVIGSDGSLVGSLGADVRWVLDARTGSSFVAGLIYNQPMGSLKPSFGFILGGHIQFSTAGK